MSYFYEARATKNGVPLSVQVLHRRLPDGTSHKHPLHYHDYTELLFGLTGAARVLIGADTLPLTPGDMIVIHNGVPHNVIAESDEECTYTVVKFLPQILFAGEQSYSEYAYAFLLMENTPGRRILFSAGSLQDTDIAERFARLEEEFFSQAFGYELALRAEVTAIVLFILRRWQKEDPARFAALDVGRQRQILRRAISYIKENYAVLTEGEVAAAVGVTPAYLSRVFRRGMHTTFSDFLGTVRLGEAERLLLTTDKSVTEIAETVGFSTAAYFISLFRKTHEETPARYRRRRRVGES